MSLHLAIVATLSTIAIAVSSAKADQPSSAPTRNRSVIIRNASVLDVAAGKWLRNQTITIRNDRIVAMTSSDEKIDLPDSGQVLEGKGRFVIPGLIDAHVHLVHRIDFGHATGDEILPMFLAAGVTGLRDTGDEIVAETVVSHFADSHPDYCPRVFLCSGLLDGSPVIHRDVGIPIAGPDQVAKIIQDMAAWNVTTLKIYAGSRRPVGRKIIEEGHRHGLFVTGHLARYPAQEAAEDGIDCIEHITSVFDFVLSDDKRYKREERANADLKSPETQQLIRLLAEKKVMVDPTLAVYRNMLLLSDLPEYNAHPDNLPVPQRIKNHWDDYRRSQKHQPQTREMRQKEFRRYQDLVGLLHKGGVTLLAGTDTAEPYCPPGYVLHQELEMLVESGLTPADALRAATTNNAKAVRREKDLGSVEPGKMADLVILEGDPLTDIRNTRKIWRVLRSGYVSDPKSLLQRVPKE